MDKPPRADDLTDRIFGQLVVLKYLRSGLGDTFWLCRCKCGSELEGRGGSLKRGLLLACKTCRKHLRSQKMIKDISGIRFGNLVALHKTRKNLNGDWYWLCRCDCGKEYEVKGSHLRAGTTQKCRDCAGKLRRVPNPKNGYPPEFSLDLRKRIRRRDNRTCQYCGKKCGIGELDVHHIDHDRTNNSKSNLVSLCNKCHYMCHHKDSDKWVKYWQEFMNSK